MGFSAPVALAHNHAISLNSPRTEHLTRNTARARYWQQGTAYSLAREPTLNPRVLYAALVSMSTGNMPEVPHHRGRRSGGRLAGRFFRQNGSLTGRFPVR